MDHLLPASIETRMLAEEGEPMPPMAVPVVTYAVDAEEADVYAEEYKSSIWETEVRGQRHGAAGCRLQGFEGVGGPGL